MSLAHGGGFSYGSNFDSGFGVDAHLPLGAWTVRGEANQFTDPQREHFRFATGSVSFRVSETVEFFTTYYNWRDTSAQQGLGSFRSTISGVNWQATHLISIEAAGARAGDKKVAWVQFHLTWEK